ncbi:hypothetical protein [Polyangium aurulentum]|uniref:hypothetical protein n=1 Tax=Polyangium aurulentum TaxID=2567896 RepID=UPI0010ADAD0F|nr:hypothetical protein [Polyangium aurulentum]UQA60406.1 hypothetical protein E8A73_008005 [Polyangium aurulentum]
MADKDRKTVRVDRNLVAVPRERRRRRWARRGGLMERGKGVLFIAGAGAVVALLAGLDDIKNSKEAKDHWWLIPLGVMAIGYLLRKRGNPYATAVLAVGGALFAIGYAVHSKQAQAQQQQQLPPGQVPKVPQQYKPGGETKGPFFGPMASMPPSLPASASTAAAWVQMPNGQVMRVPIMPAPLGGRPFAS